MTGLLLVIVGVWLVLYTLAGDLPRKLLSLRSGGATA